jgi:hypothetical protein
VAGGITSCGGWHYSMATIADWTFRWVPSVCRLDRCRDADHTSDFFFPIVDLQRLASCLIKGEYPWCKCALALV